LPCLAYLKWQKISVWRWRAASARSLLPIVQGRAFDPGVDGAKPRPHTTSLSTGSEISDLKVQHCQRQTVLVDGLGAADQRLGLLQLRLAQFHDRGQASL